MPYPSEELRTGRRRLEEIYQLALVEDLTWDDFYNCFYIHVSIQLESEHDRIPKSTHWYITIDQNYPLGDIKIYPSKKDGINVTFPHQMNNYSVAKNGLWRSGYLCVDYNVRNLGMHAPSKEPVTIDGRLHWYAERLLAWVKCAAEGTLTTPEDPYELPDYHTQDIDVFAFNEDEVSMMQWEDSGVSYGVAYLRHLPSNGESNILFVDAFEDSRTQEKVYEPFWGDSMGSREGADKDVALWIKLKSPLVVNGWQAPMTYGELQQSCLEQEVDFWQLLRKIAPKFRDEKSHLVLFGYPVPRRYCDEPSEMVWQALKLPILSYGKYVNDKFQSGKKGYYAHQNGAAPGFRANEHGWWQNDRTSCLMITEKLHWLESQNWNSRTISVRGQYPNNIASKRFALIGAGSLGSTIAELLVRSGVTRLTCIDGDYLKIGNLCRHTLSMPDLAQYKCVALAKRLSLISPYAKVDSEPSYLKMGAGGKITPDIEKYDVVIDTTGDDQVLELIIAGMDWKKMILLSASVGLGAKRLYLSLSRKKPINTMQFLEFVKPYIQKDGEEFKTVELPRDGIGCWHPLFPARADDMWMAASTAIKAFESFLSSDSMRLYLVYESKVENGLFHGYSPVEVNYEEQ